MSKFSAIGATALGVGATNLMATPMNEKDVKWDEEYDVVIIGSGFAALAAGVTSAKKGNKVVLIERWAAQVATLSSTAVSLPFQIVTCKRKLASKIAQSYLSKTA